MADGPRIRMSRNGKIRTRHVLIAERSTVESFGLDEPSEDGTLFEEEVAVAHGQRDPSKKSARARQTR